MAKLEVELLPALSDNYVYLLREPSTDTSGVVDPATAAPVLARLGQLGRKLDWILITHHHADHTGGLAELKEATGCTAIGPRADVARIPGLDKTVVDGDTVGFGSLQAKVLATPGHTSGHVSYWFPEAEALFCGDTLFALGCGRLFEGDAATMWRSLSKLMALPDATRVYCGHEYTLSNARFAVGLEPDNATLARRAAKVEATRARGEPTIPTTIGLEKATSPFLRAADPALRRQLALETASDAEVFGEVRRRKDRA
ncbi:MAG: hydroxyacylglutathione hydrolase [Geminicoccaceae bacterium]|jgi:hydroxyacylglutathione hydrolase